MASGERSRSSLEQDRFFLALDRLLKANSLSRNLHSVLRDVALEKPSAYLKAILFCKEGCWKIDHLDDIIDAKVEMILRNIFNECDHDKARLASTQARLKSSATDLTYGEIEYSSFLQILRSIPPSNKGTFYDVGSASGRAVFTARLVHDFNACIGIELLPGLHTLAKEVEERYLQTQISRKLPYASVAFYCSDFKAFKWSDDAVVVFCHSTCFGKDLLGAFFAKATKLRVGSHVIALNSAPEESSDSFTLIETGIYEMSWGDADVFVYRRI